MNLTHIRTENGTPTLITTRAALDEIEAVMAGDDDDTEMYGSGSTYAITYPDGRKVDLRPATPAELDTIARESADSAPTPVAPEVTAHGRPAHIVTVNGKRYVVESDVSPAKTYTLSNGTERIWPGGVDYWTERNGKCFGPVRVALGNSRPGTVGAAIWAAANR